jgi:hypothetical protein
MFRRFTMGTDYHTGREKANGPWLDVPVKIHPKSPCHVPLFIVRSPHYIRTSQGFSFAFRFTVYESFESQQVAQTGVVQSRSVWGDNKPVLLKKKYRKTATPMIKVC